MTLLFSLFLNSYHFLSLLAANIFLTSLYLTDRLHEHLMIQEAFYSYFLEKNLLKNDLLLSSFC